MPRMLAIPNARKIAAPQSRTQSAFIQLNTQNVKAWGLGWAALIWCLMATWAAPMAQAVGPQDVPAGCSELVSNGAFDVIDASWSILASARPANYVTGITHTVGGYAMQLGIVDLPNASSISAVEQTINLPMGVGSIVLSFGITPPMTPRRARAICNMWIFTIRSLTSLLRGLSTSRATVASG
ncbi:MAG: hypothetical protein R3A44_21100 [Caldilineaceae bacterium]